MPDHETLRKLYGKIGDTVQKPDEIELIENIMEVEFELVNEKVRAAIENAIEIDCQTCQEFLQTRLDHCRRIKNDNPVTPDQEWPLSKHLQSCHNPICLDLDSQLLQEDR